MRTPPVLGPLLLLLGGCTDLDYRPGDWEVDVVAALPPEAETLRICIDGVGVSTVGAGNGRADVRGLPTHDTQVRIEVYALDEVALFAAAWAPIGDDTPQVDVPPASFDGTPCTASGEFAKSGEEDRLLVTRFVVE